MENKFTPELIEKAKSAKTPEELMALAIVPTKKGCGSAITPLT